MQCRMCEGSAPTIFISQLQRPWRQKYRFVLWKAGGLLRNLQHLCGIKRCILHWEIEQLKLIFSFAWCMVCYATPALPYHRQVPVMKGSVLAKAAAVGYLHLAPHAHCGSSCWLQACRIAPNIVWGARNKSKQLCLIERVRHVTAYCIIAWRTMAPAMLRNLQVKGWISHPLHPSPQCMM